MAPQIARNASEVRKSWTDDERKSRKDLAGAMQLQLRALVVLSALSSDQAGEEKHENENVVVASAC